MFLSCFGFLLVIETDSLRLVFKVRKFVFIIITFKFNEVQRKRVLDSIYIYLHIFLLFLRCRNRMQSRSWTLSSIVIMVKQVSTIFYRITATAKL